LPHSRIMIHQGSSGFRGNTPDVEVQAREIIALRDIMGDLYVKHTGQPREKNMKDMERDLFMSPIEAQKYGLIDEVVEIMPKSFTDGLKGSEE
jgi:ATP-dependent Clp protease, protease subunit